MEANKYFKTLDLEIGNDTCNLDVPLSIPLNEELSWISKTNRSSTQWLSFQVLAHKEDGLVFEGDGG